MSIWNEITGNFCSGLLFIPSPSSAVFFGGSCWMWRVCLGLTAATARMGCGVLWVHSRPQCLPPAHTWISLLVGCANLVVCPLGGEYQATVQGRGSSHSTLCWVIGGACTSWLWSCGLHAHRGGASAWGLRCCQQVHITDLPGELWAHVGQRGFGLGTTCLQERCLKLCSQKTGSHYNNKVIM